MSDCPSLQADMGRTNRSEVSPYRLEVDEEHLPSAEAFQVSNDQAFWTVSVYFWVHPYPHIERDAGSGVISSPPRKFGENFVPDRKLEEEEYNHRLLKNWYNSNLFLGNIFFTDNWLVFIRYMGHMIYQTSLIRSPMKPTLSPAHPMPKIITRISQRINRPDEGFLSLVDFLQSWFLSSPISFCR